DERVLDLLLRAAVRLGLQPPVPPRLLEDLAPLLAGVDGSLDARHGAPSFLVPTDPGACGPRAGRYPRAARPDGSSASASATSSPAGGSSSRGGAGASRPPSP